MVFEKKYWSSGEYCKRNGEQYTGYVGIYDRDGYIFETEEKLVKNDNYEAQINSSKYFFDRILDEELSLPYKKRDVVFGANDFLNKSTIKTILNRLQENNDYIFKSAIISNTLIPNADNCAILASSDNSGARYLNGIGEPIEPDENGCYNEYELVMVKNPNWDKDAKPAKKNYTFKYFDKDKGKITDAPLNEYPANYEYVPLTDLIVDIDKGVLKMYDLKSKHTTRTALDTTFYPSVDKDGIKTTPEFDFDAIVQTDLQITNVELDDKGKKFVKLMFFLLFSTKLVIFQQKYYPNEEDFSKNFESLSFVDFNKLTGDNKNVLILDKVDPASKNSLNFLDLQDMRIKDNYLYLVDKGLNMVIRYNAAYLLGENAPDVDDTEWDIKILRMLDLLQGDGTAEDEIYFNEPRSICADDNYIYVADTGNKCIKIYSEDFNYFKTIKSGYFTNQEIEYICVNPYSFTLEDGTKVAENSLWIFSTIGNNINVTVMSNFRQVYYKQIRNIELLDDKWTWDEKIKSVKFSFTNSNYYFICTTKRVYKVHISRPYYPFASLSYFKQRNILSNLVWSTTPYPWHELPAGEGEQSINITWNYHPSETSAEVLRNAGFALAGIDSTEKIESSDKQFKDQKQFNGDIIFHIGSLYDQGAVDTYIKRNNVTFDEIPKDKLATMVKCSGIFIYNEPATFIYSVTKPDIPCYISEEINQIDDTEYINPFTFNKLVYKVIFNLVNIKNILMGKFQAGANLDNIIIYDSIILDDYFQSMRIENNDDFFIHDNEPTSIIVNRIFEKIHDLQEKFLSHMEAKFISSPSFANNNFRII